MPRQGPGVTDADPAVPAPRRGADPAAAGVLAAVDAHGRLRRPRLRAGTAAAYRRDWGQFTVWCYSTGQRPLPAPARTLARYVTVLADTGTSGGHHRAGIRRDLGTAAEQERALLREDLARLA